MKLKNKPLRNHYFRVDNALEPPNGQPITFTKSKRGKADTVFISYPKFRNLLALSVVMGFVFGFWVGLLYHGGF